MLRGGVSGAAATEDRIAMPEARRSPEWWLLAAVYYLVGILIAALLPGIVDRPFIRLYRAVWPSASLVVILWRGMAVHAVLAAVSGFALQLFCLRWREKWNVSAAKWVWVAGALFLIGGAVMRAPLIMAEGHGLFLVRIWQHFLGADVVQFRRGLAILDVVLFTGMFIHALSYSIGAALAESFRESRAVKASLVPVIPAQS